jgi:hypothetical protein
VAEEATRPTATAKGQVKRLKLMVSRLLGLVKTTSSTSIAAGYPAKLWASFGPISRAPGARGALSTDRSINGDATVTTRPTRSDQPTFS